MSGACTRFSRRAAGGFSLLEVMVALALLALSFTALVLVQGRATNLASQARDISIATQLARFQLSECKREAQKQITALSDFKLDGDFTDQGFPEFKWECHAPKFNMKPPSASQLEKGFKDKAKDVKKDANTEGTASSVSAPFISMITDSLGNSVRELAVIIRWTDNTVEEEMRVVTHIIDLTAMSALARMLAEGAKTFQKNIPGAKKEGAQGEEGAGVDDAMPRQPGGPPGGPGGGGPGGPRGPGGPGGGPPGGPGGPSGGQMPGGRR